MIEIFDIDLNLCLESAVWASFGTAIRKDSFRFAHKQMIPMFGEVLALVHDADEIIEFYGVISRNFIEISDQAFFFPNVIPEDLTIMIGDNIFEETMTPIKDIWITCFRYIMEESELELTSELLFDFPPEMGESGEKKRMGRIQRL